MRTKGATCPLRLRCSAVLSVSPYFRMNWPRTNRIVAAFVFVYALVLYLLTVAPTTSFWDSGEFIAIAHGLQVSHPPGAPFFMLVGRLFSMFVPTEYVALSINLMSVLASAGTVLLTYLIIVQLVRTWQGDDRSALDEIAAMAGGVIGALTFAATDSFWFNAVEAEVYAGSMLFTALVVWLILRWSDAARTEEATLPGDAHPFSLQANRYLVLIAYLFGLAIGVHLLNLLAVFFIALIFFFTEYEREEWTTGKRVMGLIAAGIASSLVFLFVYPGIVQVLPTMAGASGTPLLFLLAVVVLVGIGVWQTQKRRMPAFNLVMLSIMFLLLGYSTYGVIFIRSAADPPIDENDPETTEAIVSYLKREQYGQTPLLSGPSYDNATGRQTTRDVSFPRRWSPDPTHMRAYAQYDSDWDFFLGYQIGHMYWRYFGWQFVGKDSDVQNAPVITGANFIDRGIENRQPYFQTPSEKASRNGYFALPLLLGLLGMVYHFMRDWRRAFSVLVLFFITGIGIILYLNQPPFQPRERDYSYVASFFAFALWIGIGGTGLIEMVLTGLKNLAEPARRTLALAVAVAAFLAVPGWMVVENYYDHDRSGRYVAPDYAYNMLSSVAENGILFTNGDNDTFPLWYLQEVERERTDVRVANLSLLQTPWYVKQLKNQASRLSEPLPISLSDSEIERIAPVQWQPRDVSLPVDVAALQGSEMEQSLLSAQTTGGAQLQNPMTWRLNGRQLGQDFYALYPNDLVVLNMLQTNAAQQNWERPIYFAVTVSPDGQLDLQNYFQLEGQAYRVVPIRHNERQGRVVQGITDVNLKNFRFRGLDDPDVYFDENIRRMVDNYRNIFTSVAESLIRDGYREEARSLLDTILVNVPFETIPGDERSFSFMARAYLLLGDTAQAQIILDKARPYALAILDDAYRHYQRSGSLRELEAAVQFSQLIQLGYIGAEAFEKASAFGDEVADVMQDSTFRLTPAEARARFSQAREGMGLSPASTLPDTTNAPD